ncbi:MAG: hypothetical protein ACI9WU_004508 [Myxococcota bacterium]|jgi:hypothetical protein
MCECYGGGVNRAILTTGMLAAGMLLAGCEPSPPQRLSPELLVGLAVSTPDTPDEGQTGPQPTEPDAGGQATSTDWPDGLVAWWGFDEGSGFLAHSQAGTCENSCSGVLHGQPNPGDEWRTTGKGSGWRADGSTDDAMILMLDGDNDYVTVPDATRALATGDAMTVEARIRVRPFAEGDAGTVASIGDHDDPRHLALVVDDEGYLGAEIQGCPNDYLSAPVHVLPVDTWVHVALTIQAHEAWLYVDGERRSYCGSRAPGAIDEADILALGARLTGDTPVHGLCADIDRILLFDRRLTDSQVAELVETGQPGIGPSVDPPCSAPATGCAQGQPQGFTLSPGIAACAAPASLDQWSGDLDDACAEGWRVCTVADLVSATPSRDLESDLGADRYLLSQAGCGADLSDRWDSPPLECSASPAPCADADQGGPLVAEAGPGSHHCGSHATQCGVRRCRPLESDETVDGVLCCLPNCVSQSR